MSSIHVVWDWNGTLLDDLTIVVDSVNAGLAQYSDAVIDADGYRNSYERPVRVFYNRLLGRIVSDVEWETINDLFHDSYYRLVGGVSLTVDAIAALDAVVDRGDTQSLLSMAPHAHLMEIVEQLRLTERFDRVDGSDGSPGAEKADDLARHLSHQGVDPGRTVVIGDVPDDARAAETVGAKAVLYDGGSHHRPDLEATGWPVASTLLEALELAWDG